MEKPVVYIMVEDGQHVNPGVALTEGDKITINTDGLTVTATKTDGVATIVALNGAAAAGDKITVRF